ncbi:hypothetical protein IIC38_19015 [candidate division KSB1 bacterium]|nr:hypothetical protein [candidate division KSB1 bacterium]
MIKNENLCLQAVLAKNRKESSTPFSVPIKTIIPRILFWLNMDLWFVDDSDNLLDPCSTNNKDMIEDNIKAAIEIFEDKDDDGEDNAHDD